MEYAGLSAPATPLQRNTHRLRLLLVGLLIILAPAISLGAEPGTTPKPRKVFWDALIPPGWMPPETNIDHFFEGVQPEALSADEAPVVPEMDGQLISLPGYVVPVRSVGEDLQEFLLVPYFGACVHVPPPPPNQIVLVTLDKPIRLKDPYDAYWVTGVLSTKSASTTLAQTGYTMSGQGLELFDWDAPNPQPDPPPAAATPPG